MGRYPHLSPFSSVSRRDEEAAREIMATTGVEEFTDRPLHTLSGGERQKVYIAAALAQGGDILLLDEPTSFLDYKHQAEVVELLRRLNRESGATVIAVTHDINSAVLSSHRILALKKGQVVFTGTPAEILNPETLGGIYDAQFEFLSHPGTNATFVAPQGILP
jgi:iron complex transport system ATP-binding protein